MTGIFQGRFQSGQRLVVQSLASAYHASPTPVREALVELASLGLVDLLPNRGAVVQPFGPQEIREISQIRRLLEVEATSCACGRIPVDELSALEREFLQLEVLPHDQAWDHAGASRRFQAARPGRRLLRQSPAGGRDRPLPGPFPGVRDVSHQRDAWTNYSRSNDVPEHLAIVAALLEPDAMPRAGPWTGISGRPRSNWRRWYSPERTPSRRAGRPSGPRSLLGQPPTDFIPIDGDGLRRGRTRTPGAHGRFHTSRILRSCRRGWATERPSRITRGPSRPRCPPAPAKTGLHPCVPSETRPSSSSSSPERRVVPMGNRRAFTLIELLVVIAIIAVLIALLVAGRAGGPRGRPPRPVHQQPQAVGAGQPQLPLDQ